MKNSFVLYNDWYSLLSAFSNEEKGILLTAIFDYHCNGVLFKSDNTALQGIFNFMKSRFDSDREKYIKRCEQNRNSVNTRYAKEK